MTTNFREILEDLGSDALKDCAKDVLHGLARATPEDTTRLVQNWSVNDMTDVGEDPSRDSTGTGMLSREVGKLKSLPDSTTEIKINNATPYAGYVDDKQHYVTQGLIDATGR